MSNSELSNCHNVRDLVSFKGSQDSQGGVRWHAVPCDETQRQQSGCFITLIELTQTRKRLMIWLILTEYAESE